MINVSSYESSNDLKLPISIHNRYATKLREEQRISRLHKACYKDKEGTRYFLHKEDPKIKELGLVGNNFGFTHSQETIRKLIKAKDSVRKITLYKLDQSVKVKIQNTQEIERLLSEGWNVEKTEEDLEYISNKRYSAVSEKLSGRARYCYPDGTFYGMITKEDPAIKELNLRWMDTDKAKDQREKRLELAHEALSGSEIYNNGVEECRFKNGEDTTGWTKGRLPRSEEHLKNQREAIMKANSGKTYWNNGIECKKLPNGEHPGDGWIKGMLPRKKTK